MNLPRGRITPARTLTGISSAHWVSHFYMLVLPMLFPFFKDQLGVGYVELGLSVTVFGVVSALTQVPVGYLVDRFGARLILFLGLCLGGLGLILLGIHLSYVNLIACAALLGLANSAYHPADYAILSAHMDETRMGRAFSVHTFAGYLGGAMAPAVVAALLETIGGLGALIVAGALGPAVALLVLVLGLPDASAATAESAAPEQGDRNRSLLNRAMVVLTGFFLLLSLSTNGVSMFGVVALMGGYGAAFSTANLILTAFLVASAVGVLGGGWLADRTVRHGEFAALCFVINTVIVAAVAVTTPGPVTLFVTLTVAGFLSGVIAPSRDMMVREAAPPGASGRAFGFVTTGFNLGAIIAPPLFGWIMDHHMPHWVFGGTALFMALTVALALLPGRSRSAVPREA